jgi:signal transduction histidine kinase
MIDVVDDRSARRFRTLVTALPSHSVWTSDPAGDGLFENVHPLDAVAARRAWENALSGQHVYSAEYRLRMASGRYRWFAAYGVPVLENGAIVEWVGTLTDVHRRHVLEEGSRILRKANELFTSTLDEKTVLNRLPPILAPSLGERCTIDLSPSLDEVAGLAEGVINGDLMMISVPMMVRGEAVGIIRMASGASQRHYGEEELELVIEVARRAATAIDNARLYADAASANRAKDIFLATLSHEMKTPLTSILGWTRMLRADGPGSEIFDEALEAVEQSARVQERLIEDILDVSRVITGKLHIEKKPTNLRDVVRSAVEIVVPAARQNGVRLRIHDDDSIIVHGDETRLRQVIWNLLTNAVKFTPSGGFVEVRASRTGSEARIVVRDTGRGLRADVIPHLFEQFHQSSVADRAEHRGLGLGLAIVRHLVSAHGGRVEAYSDGEGKGSEFIVHLPLSDTIA